MLKKFKQVVINNKFSILIVIVLLLTQYICAIDFGGRILHIYYVEFLLLLIWFGIFIKLIIAKKNIFNVKYKYLILTAASFIVWFIILMVYWYFINKNIVGLFIVFRIIILPLILLFLFDFYKVSKKYILTGLIVFLSIINLHQIFDIIILQQSFRKLDSLQNINIYLCFFIILIPTLLHTIKKSNELFVGYSKKINYIILTNIFVGTIISLLSGSRLVFILLPVVFLTSYLNNYKVLFASTKKIFIFSLTLFITCFMLYLFNINDAKNSLSRSTNQIFDILNIFKNDSKSLSEDSVPVIVTNNITDSNTMRDMLWAKSIETIKHNIIFGQGKIDVEIDMIFQNDINHPVKFIQPSHNFVLEIWLCFGIVGLAIYFAMILCLLYLVLFNNNLFTSKVNYILSLMAVYGFSFLQPLITSWFAISITFWLINYLYINDESRGKL